MKKFKLFIENILVYGLGGIINKIIPLIMVPIVTRLMPDSAYYGISDLSNTVVQFGSALAVMGMYDAMYRMFFEKEELEYRKDICSTALVFTLGTSVVIFGLMILCRKWIAQYVFSDRRYGYLVYISAIATLVGATNSIVSAPTRMQNQRRVFLIMNTVSPVLSYAISVPLLLAGHYLIALPLAAAVAGITSEVIFLFINHSWFQFGRFRRKYLKPLLMIAIPLLPNFLIYWVFNSCDKLMITNMIGVGATGIYTVGAKLGHASQLIYTAFAGGWQYFAFSTMKEAHQVESNSKIFEYLGLISFACAMFVFALSRPIYQLLFTGEYVAGYIIAPYLFLAPLMQMLFQIACNQFLVIKKTWPNLFILTGGAVVNLLLNLWLIPILGIEGAAIATLVGYAVSDVVCVAVLVRMRLHVVSGRFLLAVAILLGYILLWRFGIKDSVLLSLALAAAGAAAFVLLFYRDISALLRGIRGK